ncbi:MULTISPECIES: alpha-L-arabinofuranosidase C-terminal domain-containing protein [unclassified Caulobacter]|uniref:alpha-L-arabinofuranosidase C-terminal domain-containing protein n=1 Tax=unclassified Caulobacter TaxID=2648921 RepID=UPI0006FE2436|nr:MULTISPECIES: alpha-L-arabinofuranosidase C-terminal domain-containing protein [unclassified Caulobacter]KQV58472.1 alpha-N-arabinofuranosidase [Caulobacter sp. Root342]KQV69020.1 alpha-N-arabinofuranosidase [Caulobacter sp. Root343]
MRSRLMLAACLGWAISGAAEAASAEPVKVTIDGARRAAAVTKYEYGMFIEPIGGLVARTLWAEMLDDRKFYYPVVPAALDTPPPLNAEGRPGVSYRKWRPIGGDDAVIMDKAAPYVGAQSPRIVVDPATRKGLSQAGIGLAKGKRYDGYVQISGDAGAQVEVALVWGPGPNDRQVIALPALGGDWKRADFNFTPTADAADARLEITGLGSGAFRIGAVSLMPADNVRGWRADTTAIARSLNSGMWRLPGGNFLSDWDWHGAIGPRDKRAPMFDHAWSAMQPNDIGMDEWLDLTKIIGVEPYVTVNAGLGDANSAAEEVEYLNGPATSAWGARRAANGHPEPYGVKFWNIGNEPYGWWQIGKTSLDYFMIKHNAFAEAMRAVDPTITLIGSGAMPDQGHPRGTKENASLESVAPKFGTEWDWTGGLLAKAWGNFDGISEHWYDQPEKRPDAPADAELMEYARSPSNQVRMKAEQWKIYQQRFPAMTAKKIFLSIDEYAYFGEVNLKSALAYAMVMQEMLRHTDFLTMAAFTTGASTMDITPTAATLNTTGLVFKLYGEHFGAGVVPVAVDGDAPQPEPRYPVGFNHPKVRAGSPTYPLDVIAGLSPDGRTLKVGVVNATQTPQTVRLDLKALALRGAGQKWTLSGSSLAAANKVGAPAGVSITPSAARPSASLVVSPVSATVFEFPIDPRGR